MLYSQPDMSKTETASDPPNLQEYVSTNHSLLRCKTLSAPFSNNVLFCLSKLPQKQDSRQLCIDKTLL